MEVTKITSIQTHTNITENIASLGRFIKVFSGMLDAFKENKSILFIISKLACTVNNLSQVMVNISESQN